MSCTTENIEAAIALGNVERIASEERLARAIAERRVIAALNACKGISTEALEAGVVEDVVYYLHAAMEWIDAVPDDVVATLPAMPGFDRDKLSDALALLDTKP